MKRRVVVAFALVLLFALQALASDEWFVVKDDGKQFLAVHIPSVKRVEDMAYVWTRQSNTTLPLCSVFWQIDCATDTYRILSIKAVDSGKSLGGRGPWDVVAPESIMDFIKRGVCGHDFGNNSRPKAPTGFKRVM